MGTQISLFDGTAPAQPAPPAPPVDPGRAMIETWPQAPECSNRYWLIFPNGLRVLYLRAQGDNGLCRVGVPVLGRVFSGPDFWDDIWTPLTEAVGEFAVRHGEDGPFCGSTVAWRRETQSYVMGG